MDTAEPLVIQNPNPTNPPEQPRDFRNYFKKRTHLLIFGSLLLVILVELIFGARVLMRQTVQKINPTAKIYPLGEGKIVLVTPKSEYKIGEVVPLSIKIVTGGRSTDSTDLVLKYDSRALEASKSAFIRLGRIYKDYPVADFDPAQGIVKISGTTPPKETGFTGIGNLATVFFVAKTAGKTNVSVDFAANSTADSNIVLAGSTKDILSAVINADIMVYERVAQSEEKEESIVCPGFYQYCQSGDGSSGKQYCNSGIYSNNECVFDPELTVACSVCKTN